MRSTWNPRENNVTVAAAGQLDPPACALLACLADVAATTALTVSVSVSQGRGPGRILPRHTRTCNLYRLLHLLLHLGLHLNPAIFTLAVGHPAPRLRPCRTAYTNRDHSGEVSIHTSMLAQLTYVMQVEMPTSCPGFTKLQCLAKDHAWFDWSVAPIPSQTLNIGLCSPRPAGHLGQGRSAHNVALRLSRHDAEHGRPFPCSDDKVAVSLYM